VFDESGGKDRQVCPCSGRLGKGIQDTGFRSLRVFRRELGIGNYHAFNLIQGTDFAQKDSLWVPLKLASLFSCI
jgi:hypothetical protein